MRPAPSTRLGMTLIELMIAITVAALATSGAVFAVGAITRTKLKAASMRVIAASRYARHRAITQGRTVRVVIDLDTDMMGIEESNSRVTLSGPSSDDEQEEAVDAWETAQLLVSNPDEPALGASSFSPIVDEDGDPVERFLEHPLEGVNALRFHSPHEVEPRERGRVAFYYFPTGIGERTYVVLADARGNKMTVELDPVSSRGKVHAGALDVEAIRRDAPRDPG